MVLIEFNCVFLAEGKHLLILYGEKDRLILYGGRQAHFVWRKTRAYLYGGKHLLILHGGKDGLILYGELWERKCGTRGERGDCR